MDRIYMSLGLWLYLLRRKEGSKRWRAVARFMRWAAVLISAARCEDGRSGGIQLGSRLPRSRDTKLVPSTPSRITWCAQQEWPTLDTGWCFKCSINSSVWNRWTCILWNVMAIKKLKSCLLHKSIYCAGSDAIYANFGRLLFRAPTLSTRPSNHCSHDSKDPWATVDCTRGIWW